MEITTNRVPDLPLCAIRIAELNPVYPELARSSLLVGSLTQDGELQLVSAGWARALGCSMGRLAGRRFAGFIDREDVQQAKALFQSRSGELGSKPVSFRLVGCDGTKKRYEWHARKDRLDEVLFIVGTERNAAPDYSENVSSLPYSAAITP